MLHEAGLRLERVTVQRRLKGRPIRKVYLAVQPARRESVSQHGWEHFTVVLLPAWMAAR